MHFRFNVMGVEIQPTELYVASMYVSVVVKKTAENYHWEQRDLVETS